MAAASDPHVSPRDDQSGDDRSVDQSRASLGCAMTTKPVAINEYIRQKLYELYRGMLLQDAATPDIGWLSYIVIMTIFRAILTKVDLKRQEDEKEGRPFVLQPLNPETVTACPELARWATEIGDKWLENIAEHCRVHQDHIPYVARWFPKYKYDEMVRECIIDYDALLTIARVHETEEDAARAFLLHINMPGNMRSVLGEFHTSSPLPRHANLLNVFTPMTSRLSMAEFASFGCPGVGNRSAFIAYGIDPTRQGMASMVTTVRDLVTNVTPLVKSWGSTINTLTGQLKSFTSV